MLEAKSEKYEIPTGGPDLDEYWRTQDDAALVEIKLDIMEDIGEIKAQIREAKVLAATKGVYSDPDWFRRVNGAQRVKANQYNSLCAEQGRRRRERLAAEHKVIDAGKTGGDFARAFYRAAKEMLDEVTFDSIKKRSVEVLSEGLEG